MIKKLKYLLVGAALATASLIAWAQTPTIFNSIRVNTQSDLRGTIVNGTTGTVVVDDNLTVNGTIVGTSFSGNGALLTSLNASNLASGTIPDGRFPATLPASSGANLTNLNASNLASGTIPDARFPATLPAISGANLTNLNASQILSGTLGDARLSANVPLLNGTNAFTGGNTFNVGGGGVELTVAANLTTITNLTVSGICTGCTSTGTVTAVGTPLNNQVAVWTGATTVEGDANYTWDGTNQTLELTGLGEDLGFNPRILINSTGADANNRVWGLENVSGGGGSSQLLFSTYLDDLSLNETYIRLDAAGSISVPKDIGFDAAAIFDNSVTVNNTFEFAMGSTVIFQPASIDDSALSSNVPLLNAANTFTGASQTLSASNARFVLYDTGGGTNQKGNLLRADGDSFSIRSLSDALAEVEVLLQGTKNTSGEWTSFSVSADTVQLNASTLLDFNGAADFSSTVTVGGTLIPVANILWSGDTDTGIVHPGADQLQIFANNAAVADFSQSEIDLTATLIDINGNVDISGTCTGCGGVDDSGSFTATFDDSCSISPTIDFQYQLVGNVATVWIQDLADITGFPCTGDSTGFATTGTPVPASIRPTASKSGQIIMGMTDNGTGSQPARIRINPSGTMDILRCSTTFGTSCAGWTAAGNRSVGNILSEGMVTYGL